MLTCLSESLEDASPTQKMNQLVETETTEQDGKEHHEEAQS